VITTSLTSCSKEEDTIAKIIVKNNEGVVVPYVRVTLYPNTTLISEQGETPLKPLTKTNITDSNGKAEFTYDLEAVLEIEATILIGNDNFQGKNSINLLKGKTTTKVVEISKI
tara:strand:- start:510 stop:848 length:339 start_codon:yes stop_codon:yes gene_type:complete